MAATPRILVLDDDPNLPEALAKKLEPSWEVSVFAQQDLALKALASGDYDIILSELALRSSSGTAFLTHARRLAPRAIRGLLTASRDFMALANAVNSAGVQRVITKPIQVAEFVSLLLIVRPDSVFDVPPTQAPSPASMPAAFAVSSAPSQSRREKILIVDDSETVIDFTQETLGEAGFATVALSNPFQLFTCIQQEKPDLVLLDVRMPAIDGPRLIEAMERQSLLPKSKVIFHSSLPAEELANLVQEWGVGGFIRKGSEADLIQAVNSHLAVR